MKFRRRRSLMPRIDWRRSLEPSGPLKGQLWTRSEKALREPDVRWAWRGLAVGAAVAEAALLAWLWFGPALSVRAVEVAGAHHMTRAEVARVLGLGEGRSVLAVDGEADRQRLLDQTWVRTASVEPRLPGTILIQISEWQPVAAYHAGKSSKLFLLSSQAVVLGPASAAGALVDVQGPGGADPKAGARPLDPLLLTALVNIQRELPSLIGQEVGGFTFDSCGVLTLEAKRGWKVYFGRVLTPEEFASLHDKLAALKAINGNGNVDYNSSDLAYVNVMNPAEPAVAYKSREAAAPSPSPGTTSPPSPSPAAVCK
ncbi:FtsQ-type POTRA domain-containing protein [bacterium]|nr:MAG: FtsQ-type POTRA domain-containing protein [bacterium]